MSRLLAVLLAALPVGSCSDDVDSYYAPFGAFFRYAAVNTTPQLLSACTTPGQYCAITHSAGYFIFTGPDGSSTRYPTTAVDQYGEPVYISGFLVGTPAIPTTAGAYQLEAYDLVCPGCYEESYIQRQLAFATTTTMHCSRCLRTYDLNAQGIVSAGPGGPALYRYHVSYAAAQGVLVIQN